MADHAAQPKQFDRAAAVTRSLLGYGVLAGAFYLIVGIAQAIARDGFDVTRHPLSVLMLGDFGWIQRLNLALTGLMVIAAAIGFARAMRRPARRNPTAILVGIFGGCLIASGIFRPDPVDGFPPGSTAGGGSAEGVLHLAFGGIGFLCLAAGAFTYASWCAGRSQAAWARLARAAAIVILVGFVGGAAVSGEVVGVVALWVAVVASFAWLAVASMQVYRTVPHPDTGAVRA